ncbi:MAG: endonuclease/exonuclease/phosphatase family protein [Fimbriimonadaceae bacterium]
MKAVTGCFGLMILLMMFASAAFGSHSSHSNRNEVSDLRVMAWNVWLGGKQNGTVTGPNQIIQVIQHHRADVVLMQETYGSGEFFLKGLGFHFLPRGTNVSIFSRFPIEEDISVFEPFKCVGALLRLPNGRRVAVYSIWLPYAEDIWIPEIRANADDRRMLAACEPSAHDLEQILSLINKRLEGPKYADISVIIGGDFNSMSHLDWAEIGREHYGRPIEWRTSLLMAEDGYRDAFREANPAIDRDADSTWSPRFPEQEQERIDFVYFRGEGVEVSQSQRINDSTGPFPSDHAAVLAELKISARPPTPKEARFRVATYNIRHGRGMDEELDLDRTVRTIRSLRADIVALQEVDDRASRSGGTNQAAALGRELNMHAAYGAFMPFQGGWYGLALLSKYPFVRVRSLPLPVGNEPRVALVADVRAPNGEIFTVINVHFDWVEDDGLRFSQASAVANYLQELPDPFIVIGDFNDAPASRTLDLFRSITIEARKNSPTYPADRPTVEIDYIFAGLPDRWRVGRARVVDEPLTSDHRPVVADIILRRSD